MISIIVNCEVKMRGLNMKTKSKLNSQKSSGVILKHSALLPGAQFQTKVGPLTSQFRGGKNSLGAEETEEKVVREIKNKELKQSKHLLALMPSHRLGFATLGFVSLSLSLS